MLPQLLQGSGLIPQSFRVVSVSMGQPRGAYRDTKYHLLYKHHGSDLGLPLGYIVMVQS